MNKPQVSKRVMSLLKPLLAEVWDQGYREGAEDNRKEFGRKVRWGTASNPYRESEA